MNFMDKKILAWGFGLIVLGGTNTVPAQNQRQDRGVTERTNEEMDYENLFKDIDKTDGHDVLTLLEKDGNFSTFLELMEKSGLDVSMELADPVTVFAPTDHAFRELTVNQYEELMESEDKVRLQRIVKAHILPEEVNMSRFEGNQVFESSFGDEIPVTILGGQGAAAQGRGTVAIGGSTIIRPDVEASNGIIHVINGVILPELFENETGLGTF